MVGSPFAIAVAANLGVDDIKARTAGEIFQVLRFQVSPSPGLATPVRSRETGFSSSHRAAIQCQQCPIKSVTSRP